MASLARDRLGVFTVLAWTLTAAAPLVMICAAVVGLASTGSIGFPLAFVLVGVVLCIFSVGYVELSQHILNAGAFYAGIREGLGPAVGVGSAYIALLAYNARQVALYGVFGVTVTDFLAGKGIVDLGQRWWIAALVGWALTAVLGSVRVDLSGRLLATILFGEVAILLIWDAAFVTSPGRAGLDVSAFAPHTLFGPATGAVLLAAVTAFVGFEFAPAFSEEYRDPRRTTRRATYVGLALLTGIYAVTTWAVSIVTGPAGLVGVAGSHHGFELLAGLAEARVGAPIADIGRVLVFTSAFAALVAYHNTVSRHTFALGREGLLPRVFARTGPRTGAPTAGSLAQSLVGLAVIAVYAQRGWDPIGQLFFLGSIAGGFGVLILLILTSVAVIAVFARAGYPVPWWSCYIAPALSASILGWIAIEATRSFTTLPGVAAGVPDWALPGCFGVVAAIGVFQALVLRRARPDMYQKVGRGANYVVAPGHGGVLHIEVSSTDRVR